MANLSPKTRFFSIATLFLRPLCIGLRMIPLWLPMAKKTGTGEVLSLATVDLRSPCLIIAFSTLLFRKLRSWELQSATPWKVVVPWSS